MCVYDSSKICFIVTLSSIIILMGSCLWKLHISIFPLQSKHEYDHETTHYILVGNVKVRAHELIRDDRVFTPGVPVFSGLHYTSVTSWGQFIICNYDASFDGE